MVMNDIKEGSRLNLPNFNWVNQYQHKTRESKLADKGHRTGSMISPDLQKYD